MIMIIEAGLGMFGQTGPYSKVGYSKVGAPTGLRMSESVSTQQCTCTVVMLILW